VVQVAVEVATEARLAVQGYLVKGLLVVLVVLRPPMMAVLAVVLVQLVGTMVATVAQV
jgi:hypothetical protein